LSPEHNRGEEDQVDLAGRDPATLNAIAIRFAETGRPWEAERAFRVAAESGGAPSFNLGKLLAGQEKYEAAAEAYRAAAAQGVIDAYVNLGNILADHLNRPGEAAERAGCLVSHARLSRGGGRCVLLGAEYHFSLSATARRPDGPDE